MFPGFITYLLLQKSMHIRTRRPIFLSSVLSQVGDRVAQMLVSDDSLNLANKSTFRRTLHPNTPPRAALGLVPRSNELTLSSHSFERQFHQF